MKFIQTNTELVYFSESTVTGNIQPYSVASCTAANGNEYNYVMNNTSILLKKKEIWIIE